MGRAHVDKRPPPAAAPEAGRAAVALQRTGLCLTFCLIGVFSFHQVGGLDEGFHLRAGQYILDGNGWPRTDPFTYTRNDQPYIDTSWGYQVLLALVQRAFDAQGLVAFNTLLILAFWFVVYRTVRLHNASPTAAVVLLLAGGIASQLRYEIRPEILSYVFLATVLHVLARHATGRRGPLWSLPLLLLAWANCHSFFVLGWGGIGCHFCGSWLRDRRWDRKLAFWGGLALLAPLLNPYGLAGVFFPLGLLTRFSGNNVFSRTIAELVSPFSPKLASRYAFFPAWPIYTYRLLAVAAGISLWPLWRRRAYASMLLIVVFGSISASMTRNMAFLGVACLPGIVAGMSGLAASIRRRLGGRTWAVGRWSALGCSCLCCAVLISRVATNAFYIDHRQEQRFGWGWNRLILPVEAAEYLRRVRPAGRMLNYLNFGGYLMFAQASPVFIDARLEVMGEEFFSEYFAIKSSPEAFDRLVARHAIDYVIYPHVTNPRLTNRLSADSAWCLTYFDHLAAVFVRNRPGVERLIDASVANLGLHSPEIIPLDTLPGLYGAPRLRGARRWLEGCVYRQHYPSDAYQRALFHLSRSDLPQAVAALTQAISRTEGAYFELYRSLGAALQSINQVEAARQCFEIVVEEAPHDRLAAAALAAPN
jgi:hypothetical protein